MKHAREWAKYDIVKNAAIGAIIGACGSFVIPFMRPAKGAFIGALALVLIGVYKNLSRKSSAITMDEDLPSPRVDIAEEIQKFDNLRKSGAISEEEFQTRKSKLLNQ
ncbi:SHOCT domain-containing protein [Comamonas aquatica]|uniref:SHOCT domain-containing protein n=1 Tax=Comamonas aquatica TaxID=225991 RepID=UPI00244736DC|nr:SHOCT domain-containing protein [Comamonas aquatica]MDH0381823.1 SHOCT domain-containing protein [Comamonas aquatica]MDH0429968.1 SHOCT domain-containing protein [Comamonas aquatica]MDH0900495.1 SHOCT domain-containing protein [Comamonas aquatica]MDH0940740.1 SHOCT domain-containing protein [Comamonas aquatica]MDH1380584.1 SHOCT domain-containing protein [Comamonas aquatica]